MEPVPSNNVTFSPDWIEDIVWVATRVNRHSITNRWLPVDETKNFELVMKERKAVTTQQCRILVKGAPHLPLQLSCGSSIQFLYPTWQYLKLLEAQGILPDVPKERYREVEDWMLDHVREFNEWRVKGDTSAMTRRGPISLVRKSNESPDTGTTAAATAIGGGSLDPHNTLLVLTPRGETSTDNLTSGNASLAANADPKGTVKDRLKSLWHGFRNSPNARPTTPASDEAPTTLTATTPDRNESDARLTSPAAPTQASSSSATQSFSTVPEQQQTKVSKRDAVKEFLKRKLGRTTERPPEEEDDDSSDDEDFAKQSTDAPPSLVACESLDDFRLNWKHLRRIYYEAHKKDAEGHRGHETFDRIFRRRRAVNKWQYQNREAIQEQIKANRTVAIMTVIGIYTLVMHLVPFDVFCMLLLVMEIGLHYLCTNYREIAIALGRRAARTRVDRVKDWFYFGVTRRKTRNDVDPPGGLPLED